MRPLGFSTGALAFSDFRRGLQILNEAGGTAVELSALRQSELLPLTSSLAALDLGRYLHISVHLPSAIDAQFEPLLLELTHQIPLDWKLITHPNIIKSWSAWAELGSRVCVENMDKRKEIGQTARHLQRIFDRLPDASFCFDIGHAHQIDPTMGEAVLLLEEFREKLCQLHVSEVNSESKHDPISLEVAMAFEVVASLIPDDVPAILESRIPPKTDPVAQARSEMHLVERLLVSPVHIACD
jgi:hypothetical protein